jgi:hypothetical protein
MQFLAYLHDHAPHFSSGQTVSVVMVWAGCYIWKVVSGLKVPESAKVDRCFGVRVTPGYKVPAATRSDR